MLSRAEVLLCAGALALDVRHNRIDRYSSKKLIAFLCVVSVSRRKLVDKPRRIDDPYFLAKQMDRRASDLC